MSYSSNHWGRRISWRINWHLNQVFPDWEWTPGRIAIAYTVFGMSGLFLSDVLLVQLVTDTRLLRQVQAVKGFAEVVVTAGIIFVLTTRGRRTVTRKNDQLRLSKEELQVLHRVIRHNLRNDLNVVLGCIDFLDGDSANRETWKSKLIDRVHEIVHYIDQAERIDNITRSGHQRITLDVEETVRLIVDNYRDRDDVRINLDVRTPAVVKSHPNLGVAIEELVENAIEHCDQPTAEVTVRVAETETDPYNLDITVIDNGPGIPEVEQRTLESHTETNVIHSNGLGLWIAYWVASQSGGSLTMDETDSSGSILTITLPRL